MGLLTTRARSFSQKWSKMGVFLIKSGHSLRIFGMRYCNVSPPSRNPASATVLNDLGTAVLESSLQWSLIHACTRQSYELVKLTLYTWMTSKSVHMCYDEWHLKASWWLISQSRMHYSDWTLNSVSGLWLPKVLPFLTIEFGIEPIDGAEISMLEADRVVD